MKKTKHKVKKSVKQGTLLFREVDSKLGYLIIGSLGLIAALLMVLKVNNINYGIENLSPDEASQFINQAETRRNR